MPDQVANTMDVYQAALDQLTGYGLEVEHLDTTGVLRRVRHRDDKRGRKDGWYVAHEFSITGSRTLIAGAFGWWRDDCGPYRIGGQERGLSDADRAEYARLRREARKAAVRERERMAKQAAERAEKLWPRLPEMGSSRYLQTKHVHAHGVKFSRGGGLVVPVRKVTGHLVGLQFIQPDGEKRFLTGTPKQGAFHLIGAPEIGGVLAIGEGYATMASVHRATRWPSAVAFDAGNLLPVAEALAGAYPHCRIVLCGDDDHTKKINVGRTRAIEAADRAGGMALFPVFAGGVERGKDWNDLHQASGLEAVKQQLEDGVANGAPPGPPQGGEGGYPFDLGILLRHYALIYGTETVYDGRCGTIISLAGLRAAAGRKLIENWMDCDTRRLVMPEGVVFDPAGDADPQTTVNLFRGWPIAPQEGRCERLLELLYYLCGESDNVFDWVLRWTAYPLQHPGAKMRTAILMHGPEGTGKNTFWGAVSEIYGEYAAQIGQNELESQFNGWSSKKLLIIGNEVVSRQEMYHQKGRLKAMITESQWAVNEKMLPVRMEQNHANFVFFSNTIQPLTPDPDDRRYLVIWTPPALDEALYSAVGDEIAAGGAQALYHYLLHYDLDDFHEHAKPLMTRAKADLIYASMDTHERFRREWKKGELPVGYRPCLSLDLYAAYRHWCNGQGEKPAPLRIFMMAVSKHLSNERRPHYIDPGGKRRQLRAALPKTFEPPAGKSKEVALGDEYRKFAEELCQWVRSD